MPNRIVHFEIEAVDRERAKNFYAKAFGWEMQQMGQDMATTWSYGGGNQAIARIA